MEQAVAHVRDVVGHALARRALLRKVRAGLVDPQDARDASPYLRRAASTWGAATGRPCPLCARVELREVAWVFGEGLGAASGSARSPRQLVVLAETALEFTVHQVEVCTGCGWNALVRSFRTGRTRAPALRSRG